VLVPGQMFSSSVTSIPRDKLLSTGFRLSRVHRQGDL